ncbi:MAG: WD40 repeat domain-containing protein [Bryobacteraceae bacterium]|nr:WD40 repeat domain-containing protein [Bryobacterales bacterium]MEB2362294.1 WD40 repeat domain-containing protein [Bryobacterales bacterium]NUN02910.1 WD40 repeat domain-containing protein [Bryobacteraceae bacterium]
MIRPFALSVALGGLLLQGASTTAWEMSTYQDFLRGRFTGVSLTKSGRLMLAPKLETVLASDQPVIWSIVRGKDGSIYAGSGHRGRLYRIDASGKSSVLWTADQSEIFALAVDPSGTVFAATSPDGKIYRIRNGKAEEYFAPGAKYIWALAFDKDGVLYAGTGDQGKVFRVTAPERGEVYYETGQLHITSLAFDPEGRLLAGSDPNGILYRISAKDKAFVLYDANLPEIRAVVPSTDGSVYAVALGGATINRTPSSLAPSGGAPGAVPTAAPAVSITVTDEAQGGIEVKPQPPGPKQQPQPGQTQVTTQFTPMVDMTGVEKSAIYRIHPDNTVETLWSSKEENAYDLIVYGKDLVFSTDGQGRIYRLSGDRKPTLVAQTDQGETTRLLDTNEGFYAATATLGKVLRLSTGTSASGAYESPVHDANTVARWGRLSWKANREAGAKLAFRTRSGNSARPDKTWSEWSEPLEDASNGLVSSPNARYIQWRAEFSSSADASPSLDSVSLAYLPQNTSPVVRSITVTSSIAASAQKPPVQQATATAAYSITVTDTGDTAASTSTGTPTETLSRAGSEQLAVSWQADDADGDKLVYSIFFRGEEEREWKTLRENIPEASLTFDGDVFADGKYYFLVRASDRLVNPLDSAREAELVSAPVLIDHTPPMVQISAPRRSAGAVELDIQGADQASPLRKAEYAIDAGPWTPLQALDGIIDSEREQFRLRLETLAPGEHLVVVRVYDSASNAGLAKIVLR